MIKSRKRARPQAEKHLFTNTAYCADCGRGMHYKTNSKGYICGNYNKHGAKACNSHLVREADLHSAILQDLKTLVSSLNNDSIMRSLEAKLEKKKQESQKQIKSLLKEIELLKLKKKTLNLLVDGVISKEEYDEFINDINKQIDDLSLMKKQAESSLQTTNDELAIRELKQSIEAFMDFKELTPEILHRLIDRIEIKADGSPRILYRFSNPSAYSLILSINAQHST
ncbi:recombinase zinc beta ribbon domain-containing protein [Thermolongibacillus altinsuensis]|uniref:recombinase zinc beta ribbon domain-containing protein n=1 Tax=Thermolongibacillus altinsuensis TaxID=575256 RepID=UPI002554F8AB|nr:recombinase zinc beta ribbon domain-containing protein [Thermolongibacillus altinsuensis]